MKRLGEGQELRTKLTRGVRVGAAVALGALALLIGRPDREPAGVGPDAPVLHGFMGTDPAGEERWAPGRLLVQIENGSVTPALLQAPVERSQKAGPTVTGLDALDAAVRQAGATGFHRPFGPQRTDKAAGADVDRWFMFEFEGADDLPGLAASLAALDGVEAVSLDWRAWPSAAPTDEGYAANWGHDNRGQLPGFSWTGSQDHTGAGVGAAGFDADVPEAWARPQGQGDPGVVIAVIDSGVDADHPDLRLVPGHDFGSADGDPDDDAEDAGHGTACAGVAAATSNGSGAVGVAPGCSIMPLKVANDRGQIFFSAVQSAIYHAADHGADVISLSIGAPMDTDPAMETALRYAEAAGVVVVASAGNANRPEISYPASSPHAIAVGAAAPDGGRKRSSQDARDLNPGVMTDPLGCTADGERWWGSNYGEDSLGAGGAIDLLGPTILPTCDIAGPDGYRTGDYEPFFNGTSCAAPYVAGVAALVLSAAPELTPAELRAVLTATARDVVNEESAPGWDRYAGHGLVNAQAAVLAATSGVRIGAPVAAFAHEAAGDSPPLSVAFTDASAGDPVSWLWDFGDGGTSVERNPQHVYTAAGSYDVTLTVANGQGTDSVTMTGLVNVAGRGAALRQNHPNPFNPVTRIEFELARPGPVRLVVYNPRGLVVARLADGPHAAGPHSVTWDATGLPSGLYFYRLTGPGVDETRKMTLLK